MNQITIDNNQLKEVFKQALKELIAEDKEVFSNLMTEIIEDIALANAIKEGENTENVSRDVIFNLLNHN